MAQDPPPAPSSGKEDFYEFGIYRLDASNRSLYRSGEFVPLSPKVFDTLLVLVQEAGRVVTKDELMQKVWPDAFVEEGSITNNISTLRKILNPDFAGEGPISTVPKRGYRFTAELRLRNPEGEIAVRTPASLPEPAKSPGVDTDSDSTALAEIYGATPRNRWKIPLIISAGLLVLAVAVFNIYVVSGHRTISEKDTIVITDFTNKTGDAVFDDALKQALIFDLEQSPRLNIVSDRKVASTLLLMGRTVEDRVSGETARELCQRVASKAMLVGTISSLESEYLIGIQAVNCENGETIVAEQARATGRGKVLNALDQAASRLREKLGESLSSIQKFSTPVDEVTTSSLQALKSYSIGRKMTNGKGDLAALPYLERAVELDPNFAVGYSGLALSYGNVGQSTRALAAAQKAYELRNRASEHEKYRIIGSYHINGTGDLDKAIQNYDLWARDYPRDMPPFTNLGNCYMLLGRLDDALRETEIASRMEKTSSTDNGNMAAIQLGLNRLDDAKNTSIAALQYTPDAFVIHLPLYQVAFLQGDTALMQQQIQWGENHPGDGDWLIDANGDSEAYYGRLQSASTYFERAISSAQKLDNAEMASAWLAKLALIEAEFGNSVAARQYAQRSFAGTPGRDVRAFAALALARIGDVAQAKRFAADLHKEFPQNTLLQKYWLPAIQAAIELNSQDSAAAIRSLEQAEPLDLALTLPMDYGSMYPAYLRGLAYLKLGKGKEAAEQFQKMIDHSGVTINFALAPLAHLELARSLNAMGETEKSRAAYSHFLELWKDADANIPVLQQAKSEFATIDSKSH